MQIVLFHSFYCARLMRISNGLENLLYSLATYYVKCDYLEDDLCFVGAKYRKVEYISNIVMVIPAFSFILEREYKLAFVDILIHNAGKTILKLMKRPKLKKVS